MGKTDPILAVRDVAASSNWYQSVFGCKSMHGGNEFDILVFENNEVFICLHCWEEHGHPTMIDPTISPGNGLILYFRTATLNDIRQNIQKMEYPVEREIQMNPNSRNLEFSLRDPDGYYWTITTFHQYKG